jgi:hypothetical protein
VGATVPSAAVLEKKEGGLEKMNMIGGSRLSEGNKKKERETAGGFSGLLCWAVLPGSAQLGWVSLFFVLFPFSIFCFPVFLI